MADRLFNQLIHGIGIADVGLVKGNAIIQFIRLVARSDHHLAALLDQRRRNHPAKAACPAGNQCYFSC